MRWLFLAAMMVVMSGSGSTAAARSLALIIGNDSYASIPKLSKARSDATGYAQYFKAQGFETHVHTDLDSKGALIALSAFLDQIEPGDTVAFVFSGHGWSDGRENYLLPVDISSTGSQTLFKRQSIAVQNGVNGIVDEIAQRGARLTLVVIDACRNNPFTSKDRTRSVGVARGLVSEVAPEGTFIAFSAGAGQTALDAVSDNDPSPYSVFTRNFLKQLKKPQDLQSAFKATQLAVSELARGIGHDQRPAYYDEVVGKACLSDNCDGVILPQTGGDGDKDNNVTGSADTARMTLAVQTWEYFKDTKDPIALEAFAEEFADTPIAALARSRIRALRRDGTAPEDPATEHSEDHEDRDDENERITSVTPPIKPPVRPQNTPDRAPTAPVDKLPDWCPRASTSTEIAICSTPELARLDVTLAKLYTAKRQSTYNDLSREALRNDQRAWLKARNRCRGNRRCVERQYLRRIEELRY